MHPEFAMSFEKQRSIPTIEAGGFPVPAFNCPIPVKHTINRYFGVVDACHERVFSMHQPCVSGCSCDQNGYEIFDNFKHTHHAFEEPVCANRCQSVRHTIIFVEYLLALRQRGRYHWPRAFMLSPLRMSAS